jgi:hypothetical protein
MAKRIFIISANKLNNTGTVSYIFMFNSNAPFLEFQEYSNHYGLVELQDKTASHVDPYRLMQGMPDAIGPDGNKRWNINMYRTSRGGVTPGHRAGMGCDESSEDVEVCNFFIKSPDCVLLTHTDALPKLRLACQKAGAEITVFEYDGILSTG